MVETIGQLHVKHLSNVLKDKGHLRGLKQLRFTTKRRK